MIRLVIVCRGDNVALHRKALAAATEAAEEVNGSTSVYRAYLDGVPAIALTDVEKAVALRRNGWRPTSSGELWWDEGHGNYPLDHAYEAMIAGLDRSL